MPTPQPGELPAVACRRCGKLWPHSLGVCPDDGAPLEDDTTLMTGTPTPSWNTTVNPNAGQTHAVAGKRTDARELQPGTAVGDYRIEGKIGEGAMGTVYRAVHPAIGKHVAIKVMKPRLSDELGPVERFEREARAVAAIRHPGIVDVFGFGSLEDGRSYLVMEWLEGQSLTARQGRFELHEALEILDQLARALEAAHDRGIIHRDLKPDNVFLRHVARERPIVKILDFGLAKGQHAQRLTRAGVVPGTVRFFSPEQAAGQEATEQSDQYSVALCLYFCLTGHEPYDQLQSGNPMELIRAISNSEFPRPRTYRELPEPLEAIILRAMHREPARRFPSVRDLGRALWRFAGAAHQDLWRAAYEPGAEDAPAEVAPEEAPASSWWHRFRRRRR